MEHLIKKTLIFLSFSFAILSLNAMEQKFFTASKAKAEINKKQLSKAAKEKAFKKINALTPENGKISKALLGFIEITAKDPSDESNSTSNPESDIYAMPDQPARMVYSAHIPEGSIWLDTQQNFLWVKVEEGNNQHHWVFLGRRIQD